MGLKIRAKAGSGSACNNPENTTPTVTENMQPSLRGMIGRNRDRSEGNPLTAQNQRRDRCGSWHVKVGGNQVKMLNMLMFKVFNQRRKVGHGIYSPAVKMYLLVWDSSSSKNSQCLGWGNSTRNPNRQRMSSDKLGCKFFSL